MTPPCHRVITHHSDLLERKVGAKINLKYREGTEAIMYAPVLLERIKLSDSQLTRYQIRQIPHLLRHQSISPYVGNQDAFSAKQRPWSLMRTKPGFQ